MGAFKTRILAFLVAVIMVMTSAACVFAATEEVGSDPHGVDSTKSIASVDKRSIYVEAGVDKTNKGKTSEDGYWITGLKEGQLVTITTKGGKKIYRWMKTVKITSAKGHTVKWKKVKGATKYMVKVILKNGKVKTLTTKKNKISSKYIKKGVKVRVRPIKKVKKIEYSGVLCKKAKKVK